MLHSLAVQGKKTDIDILIRSNNNETKIMQHFRITKGPPRRMGGGGGGGPVQPVQKNIYQRNINLVLFFNDEPKIKERQQLKD